MSADAVPLAECPGFHELSRWRNRSSTLVCDGGCGKALAIREFRWSCTLCDYDICPMCYQDRAARTELMPRAARIEAVLRVAGGGDGCPGDYPLSPADGPDLAIATNNKPGVKPTPGLQLPGAGHTPATTETGESWVYAPHNLASVKRDLTTFGSGAGAQPNKHLCTRPSRLGQSSSVTADADSPSASSVVLGDDGLPELAPFGMPASALVRMHTRREWLRQLCELEIGRAYRLADGEPSAFESACGLPRAAPLSVRTTHETVAAVRAKFDEERTALQQAERMEIDVMQAMGVCRSREHVTYV